MIKAVFLDPPLTGTGVTMREIKAKLDRVGFKVGYYSWFVMEEDLPTKLLEKAAERAAVIRLDGRHTLNSLKRAYAKPRLDLEI